jgi:hypothetical protein
MWQLELKLYGGQVKVTGTTNSIRELCYDEYSKFRTSTMYCARIARQFLGRSAACGATVPTHHFHVVICDIEPLSKDAVTLSNVILKVCWLHFTYCNLVAFCHLMYISFCLCIAVRSAIIFSYVREF